jgi:hypothetical protein
MIEINQGQFVDTTAGERFSCPGSHPSYTNHSHMRGAYGPGAGHAIQSVQTTKSSIDIHHEWRTPGKWFTWIKPPGPVAIFDT